MARKIFVSHVWNAQHRFYWDLIRLLDQAKRFPFEDLSVPKLRPFHGDYKAVRNDILAVLRRADVVLVINTPAITNSEPVRDELREAEEHGIPIVAIRPAPRHGKTRTSRLDIIARAHKAQWTAASIVSAIRKATKKRSDRSKTALGPVADAGYEPVSNAAAEASSANYEAGPNDEEQVIGPPLTATTREFMSASGATPTTAGQATRLRGENSSPKRPWYRRLWRW